MGFQSLYTKHRASIEERWLPIKVKVMLEEDPEKKISIIRKAQKQAAKEIHDIEVKSTFIEYLEREIKWFIKPTLSQNGSAKAQEPVQSNETLNTGESKGQITGEPVEKIDWEAGITELAFMFEILFKNAEIGYSMKQYKRRWALVAKHFTVKGEEITNIDLKAAFSRLKNSKSGKPRNHEMYEDLLPLTKKEAGFFPEE
jgi:hypothetical protein